MRFVLGTVEPAVEAVDAEEEKLRREASREELLTGRADRKLCPCGKMFVPYRSFQRFCCDAHRLKYSGGKRSSYKRRPQTEVRCQNPKCAKPFMTSDGKRRYCSTACYEQVQLDRRAETSTRACPVCGTRFVTTHWSKTYCSASCRSRARKERP